MNKAVLTFATVVSLGALAGCTGGTTYGTGVSHEKQTFDGLYNMLSIKPEEKAKIDYSSRPGLVLPANQASLPAPTDGTRNNDQNWPVSPEQRIATVRDNAPIVDDRTGTISIEERNKIKPLLGSGTGAKKRDNSNTGLDRDPTIREHLSEQANRSTVDREQLSYSDSRTRRYLTEPPVEYRTPTATAEAGDLGYDSEYVKKLQKQRKAAETASDRGQPVPIN